MHAETEPLDLKKLENFGRFMRARADQFSLLAATFGHHTSESNDFLLPCSRAAKNTEEAINKLILNIRLQKATEEDFLKVQTSLFSVLTAEAKTKFNPIGEDITLSTVFKKAETFISDHFRQDRILTTLSSFYLDKKHGAPPSQNSSLVQLINHFDFNKISPPVQSEEKKKSSDKKGGSSSIDTKALRLKTEMNTYNKDCLGEIEKVIQMQGKLGYLKPSSKLTLRSPNYRLDTSLPEDFPLAHSVGEIWKQAVKGKNPESEIKEIIKIAKKEAKDKYGANWNQVDMEKAHIEHPMQHQLYLAIAKAAISDDKLDLDLLKTNLAQLKLPAKQDEAELKSGRRLS